jgi:hypothetical protein
MRLPWGRLDNINDTYISGINFSVLGCLSFEERCCIVPEKLFSDHCKRISLLEVRDPADGFPDYSSDAREKIEANRERLKTRRISFESQATSLLATEDQLIDLLQGCKLGGECSTLIFDISSMPKRYFCFLLKRMLIMDAIKNLIVTYTSVKPEGYTPGHLAEDPMSCDQLPGFYAPLFQKGDTLVLSVGFESLNLRSIIESYQYKRGNTKIILPFPPNGYLLKRIWNTVMQLTSGNPNDIDKSNVEIIAAWDTELVYRTLERWKTDSNNFTLAPYGPKPHSLAMALFATKFDCGLIYTQPKAYNSEYCRGYRETWAYVLKWGGVPCFDYPSKIP